MNTNAGQVAKVRQQEEGSQHLRQRVMWLPSAVRIARRDTEDDYYLLAARGCRPPGLTTTTLKSPLLHVHNQSLNVRCSSVDSGNKRNEKLKLQYITKKSKETQIYTKRKENFSLF